MSLWLNLCAPSNAQMLLYLEDKDVTNEPKMVTKIKIALSDEGMCRLLASGLDDNQLKLCANICILEEQLDASVRISFRVHGAGILPHIDETG